MLKNIFIIITFKQASLIPQNDLKTIITSIQFEKNLNKILIFANSNPLER